MSHHYLRDLGYRPPVDRIRMHAEEAARKEQTPNDVCHWAFTTREGLHWYACYLCAGLEFTVSAS